MSSTSKLGFSLGKKLSVPECTLANIKTILTKGSAVLGAVYDSDDEHIITVSPEVVVEYALLCHRLGLCITATNFLDGIVTNFSGTHG